MLKHNLYYFFALPPVSTRKHLNKMKAINHHNEFHIYSLHTGAVAHESSTMKDEKEKSFMIN